MVCVVQYSVMTTTREHEDSSPNGSLGNPANLFIWRWTLFWEGKSVGLKISLEFFGKSSFIFVFPPFLLPEHGKVSNSVPTTEFF